MSVMGIDVGTSSCKVAAFSAYGNVIASASGKYSIKSPQNGRYELDPETVWESIATAIRSVNDAAMDDPVESLAVSSQGEAIIPLGLDGRCLDVSPITSDDRGRDEVRRLVETFEESRIRTITGHAVSPEFSIAKILWWRTYKKECFDSVWKFLTYEDYVAYKLGIEPTIDYTMASRTLLFDINSKKWSDDLLNVAGLSPERLARIEQSGVVVGYIPRERARSLHFSRERVAVVTGGHDQPCAAYGCGIIDDEYVGYSIGTTECITAVCAEADASRSAVNHYPYVVPGYSVILFGSQAGTRAINWIIDEFFKDELSTTADKGRNVIEQLFSRCMNKETEVIVLPHFAGSGDYLGNKAARAAFVGLTFSSSRYDILKSAFESVTYDQAIGLVEVIRARGKGVKAIRLSGGGSRCDGWMQMKSDILGLRLERMRMPDSSCMGAALLAGRGVGLFKDYADCAGIVSIEKDFIPTAECHERYQRKIAEYMEYYEAVSCRALTGKEKA